MYARAERVLGPLVFVPPAIVVTSTVRQCVGMRPGTLAGGRRAGATNRVLKDASIIATTSGRIARAAA